MIKFALATIVYVGPSRDSKLRSSSTQNKNPAGIRNGRSLDCGPAAGSFQTSSVAFLLHRDGYFRSLGDRAARPGNREHISPGASSGVRRRVRGHRTAAPRGPHGSGPQQNYAKHRLPFPPAERHREKDQRCHCPAAEAKYLPQRVLHRCS
jgi:hypothetical protein